MQPCVILDLCLVIFSVEHDQKKKKKHHNCNPYNFLQLYSKPSEAIYWIHVKNRLKVKSLFKSNIVCKSLCSMKIL